MLAWVACVSGGWQACTVACGVAVSEGAAGACAVTIMHDIKGMLRETERAGDAAMEAS